MTAGDFAYRPPLQPSEPPPSTRRAPSHPLSTEDGPCANPSLSDRRGPRQHLHFPPVGSTDLQADGHAGPRKAAGNRDGRQAVIVQSARVSGLGIARACLGGPRQFLFDAPRDFAEGRHHDQVHFLAARKRRREGFSMCFLPRPG